VGWYVGTQVPWRVCGMVNLAPLKTSARLYYTQRVVVTSRLWTMMLPGAKGGSAYVTFRRQNQAKGGL